MLQKIYRPLDDFLTTREAYHLGILHVIEETYHLGYFTNHFKVVFWKKIDLVFIPIGICYKLSTYLKLNIRLPLKTQFFIYVERDI